MQASDPEAVAAALGLRTLMPANWRAGLEAAQDEGVFVTPAIAGVVLAVGVDLRGNGDYASLVPPLLARLSETFGRAAWFSTHDGVEHHGWGLGERGAVARAYAYTEQDGTVLNQGEITDTEHLLGCFVDDPRDQSDDTEKWWPDERLVLRMAGEWAIDPSRIGERGLPASAGLLGRL
ncbi:MAG: hypothetical protein NXI31_09890 [bacterium]|nr:hypothetical protein [bacterium]